MTSLRFKQSPNDWRKLNVGWEVRTRRCHSRDVNGQLLPMDLASKFRGRSTPFAIYAMAFVGASMVVSLIMGGV